MNIDNQKRIGKYGISYFKKLVVSGKYGNITAGPYPYGESLKILKAFNLLNQQFIDYYKILALRKDATTDEIKKAYRKLALKFHPDVCKLPDSQNKFIQIQEEYEIIGDTTKRHYYNIIYDNYYKTKEKKEYSNIFEQKVQSDFNKWRTEANTNTLNLSKENL